MTMSTVDNGGNVEALVAQSQKRSAGYDILANPTAVTVTVS